jgi:hypothetical protein
VHTVEFGFLNCSVVAVDLDSGGTEFKICEGAPTIHGILCNFVVLKIWGEFCGFEDVGQIEAKERGWSQYSEMPLKKHHIASNSVVLF